MNTGRSRVTPSRSAAAAAPAAVVAGPGAPRKLEVAVLYSHTEITTLVGLTRPAKADTVSVVVGVTLLQPRTRLVVIVVAGAAPATCRTRAVVAGPIPGAKKLTWL